MTIVIIIHLLFALAVLAGIVVIPYVLGTKGIFLYGKKEGFVSILVKGVENGVFDRAVGSMMGYTIEPDGAIVESPGSPRNKFGYVWLGMWPTHSAMVFDTEQTKITNNDDGSLGLKKETYNRTIYVPIQSTERLIVNGLELIDLASKIDYDVVITYMMTNVYTAKVKNRGSNKILKSRVVEGLKEEAGGMTYPEALKRKNATGPATFQPLVTQLNHKDYGFGTLSDETGYKLISININGVELSGGQADVMSKAYGSILIAEKAAAVKIIDAKAEREKIEQVGEGTAKAKKLMVDQDLRRLEAQGKLGDKQALAYAIENSQAKVLTIGSGGPAPLINLGDDEPKKK